MEYVIVIIVSIVLLSILALVYDFKISKIKKLKELGFSKKLNEITNKLPENKVVCEEILKQLHNENNVKVVEIKTKMQRQVYILL